MTPEQISASFRAARMAAQSLAGYPGEKVPKDLDQAYEIQERGIAAWPDRVSGWKVAAVQPAWRETYPAERLAGPVFEGRIWQADDGTVGIPIFEGGYAAVETEFALKIGEDIPATLRVTEPAQLLPYVAAVHAAIELAASPLATLSALGPGAVVSDFGNNGGLVLGPELDLALLSDPAKALTSATINGEPIGSGDASRVPGGPMSALQWLAAHLAARGRTLHKGDWISTGATTGIHPVKAGDEVRVRFGTREIAGVITVARGVA